MNARPLKDLNKINGTYLQGELVTTRKALVRAFGEPQFEELSGDKTSIEWLLEFEDGTIATIYDYKREGSGYYGEEGELLADDEEYDYHIGGADLRALELVTAKVKEAN